MSRNLNELEQAKNLHHRRYFLNRMSLDLDDDDGKYLAKLKNKKNVVNQAEPPKIY